jgi:hypothetical protein
MKKIQITLTLLITFTTIDTTYAQTCDDLISYIKSIGKGETYSSINSDAISNVTFYDAIIIDYQSYYFAIVCFKRKDLFGCSEYIYQVDSDTKYNYSSSLIFSAGKAFWEHIHPYNKHLGCAPNFE